MMRLGTCLLLLVVTAMCWVLAYLMVRDGLVFIDWPDRYRRVMACCLFSGAVMVLLPALLAAMLWPAPRPRVRRWMRNENGRMVEVITEVEADE